MDSSSNILERDNFISLEDRQHLMDYYDRSYKRRLANDSFWDDREARRPYMILAEANCLSLFRSGECRLIAVTLLPCSYCATMIAAYCIPEVVYDEIYDRDMTALEIFNFYGIECTKKNKTFPEVNEPPVVDDMLI